MSWLDTILDETLEAEGWPKFTNHPADRGGPTRGGITLATLREWRGKPVTVDDVRNLTEAEARAIYTARYVTGPHLERIVDSLLRWQVVDAGILSGPKRAVEWLQEVAGGLKVDGHLGPITATRVNSLSPHWLGVRYAARRTRFLASIVASNPTQARWLNGWTNRATAFLDREADRFRDLRYGAAPNPTGG